MENLLYFILRMSFTGSIVILIVLLARFLMRRMPKIFSYLLWSVVLLRLLCPVSFPARVSVMQFVEVPAGVQERIPLPVSPASESGNGSAEHSPAAEPEGNGSREGRSLQGVSWQDFLERYASWGAAAWLAGVLAMSAYSLVSLLRFRRRLGAAVQLRDHIYLSDDISSAFVFGIRNPKIYLPSMLSQEEQEYIILHEQVHIRRKDHLIKILACAALAIHWFNPLVWLAFRLADADMEMSCDEAVMKNMGRDIRAEYSASLLKLAAGRSLLTGTLPAFGESDTGNRIRHVLQYKKPTVAAAAAAVVILAATVVFAGSSPKQEKDGGKTPDPAAPADTLADAPEDEDSADLEERESEEADSADLEKQGSEEGVDAVGYREGETWMQACGLDADFVHQMDCAFVRGMTEDTLIVDPAEYLDSTDTQRVRELGLTEARDMPDGYYFHNPQTDTQEWKIDENTEFIFIDWGLDFVRKKEDLKGQADVMIKTRDKALFQKYLNTYKDGKPGMPFFFEVENGVVKRLAEQPFA